MVATDFVGPIGGDDHQAAAADPVGQVGQQSQGRAIRPVHVFDGEDERAAGRTTAQGRVDRFE
jgi:hypothetical protein